MATVHKSTGKTQSKFKDQDFFNDFNWFNFIVGDVVWLESYRGEVDRIAGVFTGYKNEDEPIVRLLPNRDGRKLARRSIESLPNGYYWQKYLQGQ